MPIVKCLCLTESSPEPWDLGGNLLQIDANVQDVDDDSVTLVTAIDHTFVMPLDTFARRDCMPTPGMKLSFDLQETPKGRYMSRLMTGHRFSHLTDDDPP